MKRRRRKKPRKKNSLGKLLLVILLIGAGGVLAYSFRQEISRTIRSSLEKKGVVTEQKVVTLYFGARDGDFLVGEKRKIARTGEIEDEAEEMIAELAKGPRSKLIATLPPQTKLLGIQLDERGVAKANFSEALIKDHPGGTEAEVMTVYSIVNSLTSNIPQIKRVQFLVEGEKIETLTGHLSLKNPLPSNPDLIKKVEKH